MERRLAAILAADVVGYSRLMGVDEAGTLAALKAHRKELIEPKEAQYHGRTIKLMGDGALIEFPSVVEAVSFAVEVQMAMRARNAGLAEDKQILYRVGINIGDIIVEDDDIFGDGVNVAARLEGLSEPGGICIRRNVRNQVRDKLDLSFEVLGEIEVKNIARPVRAFSVVLDEKAAALVTPVEQVTEQAAATEQRRRWPVVAAAAVLVVALGGGIAIWQAGQAPPEPAVASNLARQPVTEASILVLPFDDLSADSNLGYFADGMTEDLITELARWREINVISRNSANTFKGKAVDIRQAASEMGVRYVLEGSVRKVGEQLRITAQLIDGVTDHHVWAEKIDQTGSNVLALQDKVVSKLVNTLSGTHGVIAQDETDKAWAKASVDLSEYDYYLRGHDLFYKSTPEDNARALQVWEEGLTKFPDSGLLKVKIGWGHHFNGRFGWNSGSIEDLATAARLAEEGLADPNLPAAGYRFGLWLRAYSNLYYQRDFDSTIRTAKAVVAAFPFDTEPLFWMASLVLFSGDTALADQWGNTALAREQHPRSDFYGVVAEIRYVQGRYEEAIAMLADQPQLLAEDQAYMAASYAALGREREAKQAIAKLKQNHEWFTPDVMRTFTPWRDPSVPEGAVTQLVQLGWGD